MDCMAWKPPKIPLGGANVGWWNQVSGKPKSFHVFTGFIGDPVDFTEASFMYSTALNRVKVFDEAIDVPRLCPLFNSFRKGAPFRVKYHGVHHVLAAGGNNEISALHDHRVIRVSQCKLRGQFSGPTPSLFGKRDEHTGYHYSFDSRWRSPSVLYRNLGISKFQLSLKDIAHLDREPRSFDVSAGTDLPDNPPEKKNCEGGDNKSRERIQLINPVMRTLGGISCFVFAWVFGWFAVDRLLAYDGVRAVLGFGGFFIGTGISLIGLFVFISGWWCLRCTSPDGQNKQEHEKPCHDRQIVPHKYLTSNSYWGTVIHMANVLNTDKQIAVIGALAEGSSIRSIERITGVHRDTIMRLGVKVGEGCARMLDTSMRNLPCNRLEMDEIWGFVGKKDRNVREGEDGVGSVWTFCAIDAETKLVPAFKVGNRDVTTATAFVQDVAARMAYRVQISTDGLNAYVAAMQNAFGEFVDYGQIVKTYGHEEANDHRRYSAPKFVSCEKKVVVGNPDERLISTSYVERLNATTRLHMRRLTRLTLAFSKKRENFEAAVALHFAYYNFVKRHNTLRCTPAMAAGVTGSFWTVGDLWEAAA
jgi:IS1 family transposase